MKLNQFYSGCVSLDLRSSGCVKHLDQGLLTSFMSFGDRAHKLKPALYKLQGSSSSLLSDLHLSFPQKPHVSHSCPQADTRLPTCPLILSLCPSLSRYSLLLLDITTSLHPPSISLYSPLIMWIVSAPHVWTCAAIAGSPQAQCPLSSASISTASMNDSSNGRKRD